jgi:hypothetical protein
VTFCGLLGALSVNARLPDAGLPAVGVNVTATVHVAVTATGVEVVSRMLFSTTRGEVSPSRRAAIDGFWGKGWHCHN